ncbi:MAG: helix-turn-helix domain-containing protein [Pseudomonadota bacterium]
MTAIPLPGKPVRGSTSGAPIMALFDLMGRRWAMGVLWTLSEQGPLTFRELQTRCESISPGVLNQRLKELREAGFVERGEGGYLASPLGRELYDHLLPLEDVSKNWAASLTG